MTHFNKKYITTPIYYVNGDPHIGHAYTSIAADITNRFYKMLGIPTYFTTGTDEHGLKVEQTALKNNISPQEHVDKMHLKFKDMNAKLDVHPDRFIRTTDEDHKNNIQTLWSRLYDHGYIYKGEYSGFYSKADEAFYKESDLREDGRANTGAEVEFITEECYFFKLSKFQDYLLELYSSSENFVMPKSRLNEVVEFVKRGLNDLAISRKITWGTSVPEDSSHVIYVWFDALCNYLTSVKNDKNMMANAIHLVGKDILIFHAVYWPAFLKALDFGAPKRIFAHGWWKVNDEKMSKSIGNVISADELLKTCSSDQLRFFLMKETTFGNDGAISHESMIQKINAELSNNFGNLVQRTFGFIAKYFPLIELNNQDSTDNDLIFKTEELYELIENQKISEYINLLFIKSTEINKYIDDIKPWVMIKTDKMQTQKELISILHKIAQLAFFLYPIIPNTSEKILNVIAVDNIIMKFKQNINNNRKTQVDCFLKIDKDLKCILKNKLILTNIKVFDLIN